MNDRVFFFLLVFYLFIATFNGVDHRNVLVSVMTVVIALCVLYADVIYTIRGALLHLLFALASQRCKSIPSLITFIS